MWVAVRRPDLPNGVGFTIVKKMLEEITLKWFMNGIIINYLSQMEDL